jgi:hypothetical protein
MPNRKCGGFPFEAMMRVPPYFGNSAANEIDARNKDVVKKAIDVVVTERNTSFFMKSNLISKDFDSFYKSFATWNVF